MDSSLRKRKEGDRKEADDVLSEPGENGFNDEEEDTSSRSKSEDFGDLRREERRTICQLRLS